MTMPIASIAQLVLVIRGQLSGQTPAGISSAAGGRKTGPRKQVAGDRYAEENLAALIALRVRQIGRDDPGRGRKAFRVFLEAVLASHFGEAVVNDPGFHQMVSDVQQAMEANPECARLIGQAIEQLLAENKR